MSRYSSRDAASTTSPDRGTSPFGTFTAVHVALSLIGIAAGFVVMIGLLRGMQLRGWTALFLVTTVATSVFVGVVQAFLRIPALHALAPQQNEPPFVIVQLIVLAGFILLTIAAAKRFRGAAPVRV